MNAKIKQRWEVYLVDGRTVQVDAETIGATGTDIYFTNGDNHHAPYVALFAWDSVAGYKLIGDAE